MNYRDFYPSHCLFLTQLISKGTEVLQCPGNPSLQEQLFSSGFIASRSSRPSIDCRQASMERRRKKCPVADRRRGERSQTSAEMSGITLTLARTVVALPLGRPGSLSTRLVTASFPDDSCPISSPTLGRTWGCVWVKGGPQPWDDLRKQGYTFAKHVLESE